MKTLANKTLVAIAVAISSTQTLSAQDTIPTLVVNDSATFNKVIVQGETNLRENATASRDFTIEQNLNVLGDATFGGVVNLQSVHELTNFEDVQFIFRDPATGQLKRGSADAVRNISYSKFCTSINGIVANPFWANGPNKLFVSCPEVRVGIGTENPSHNLHLVGNALFQSTLQLNGQMGIGTEPHYFSMVKIANPTKGAAVEIDNSANTGQYQKILFIKHSEPSTEIINAYNAATGISSFLVTGDGGLTVHDGTRKTLQLEPGGLLRSRRIFIDQESWADDVFESSYQLMTLDQLSDFIKANKHLPHIPSEQEMITNGNDLAETTKDLTRTVEELTLYLLQQNETIELLEQKIELLQAEINKTK